MIFFACYCPCRCNGEMLLTYWCWNFLFFLYCLSWLLRLLILNTIVNFIFFFMSMFFLGFFFMSSFFLLFMYCLLKVLMLSRLAFWLFSSRCFLNYKFFDIAICPLVFLIRSLFYLNFNLMNSWFSPVSWCWPVWWSTINLYWSSSIIYLLINICKQSVLIYCYRFLFLRSVITLLDIYLLWLYPARLITWGILRWAACLGFIL